MGKKPAAIKVRNLGKKYRIGGQQEQYLTFRDTIANTLRAPLKRLTSAGALPEIWALKNISFDVEEGEVIGIIGRNGAGKSTLLKILSRITTPTEGHAEISGRVGSLLEVGTGFSPELTGRENIYLNGSILGMRKSEIDQKFDEIIKFSELEQFLDTPVKRYSSGMYIRLAFAVAAHLEPEILLVDEVLAVGDVMFQKKCLGKMGDVAKEGRTILFVSHNMSAIQRLCHTALLLEKGLLIDNGEVTRVVNKYLETGCEPMIFWRCSDPQNKDAFIESILISDENNPECSVLTMNSKIQLTITLVVQKEVPNLRLAVAVVNYFGDTLFSSSPEDAGESTPEKCGQYRATIQFPEAIFMAKTYGVRVALYVPEKKGIDLVESIRFSVEDVAHWSNIKYGGRAGNLFIRGSWEVTRME